MNSDAIVEYATIGTTVPVLKLIINSGIYLFHDEKTIKNAEEEELLKLIEYAGLVRVQLTYKKLFDGTPASMKLIDFLKQERPVFCDKYNLIINEFEKNK